MSRRTAEASKAIRKAWENEQQRVIEGKGTRDWTEEQQQSIIEKGKVYDDDGKAFEGQHMRSAETYPESQGDPDNIQFLTREEHLAAHDGDWRNSTNWYYDPIKKEKIDFGDGPIIPCEVIELSNPISIKTETTGGNNDRDSESDKTDGHEDSNEKNDSVENKHDSSESYIDNTNALEKNETEDNLFSEVAAEDSYETDETTTESDANEDINNINSASNAKTRYSPNHKKRNHG